MRFVERAREHEDAAQRRLVGHCVGREIADADDGRRCFDLIVEVGGDEGEVDLVADAEPGAVGDDAVHEELVDRVGIRESPGPHVRELERELVVGGRKQRARVQPVRCRRRHR